MPSVKCEKSQAEGLEREVERDQHSRLPTFDENQGSCGEDVKLPANINSEKERRGEKEKIYQQPNASQKERITLETRMVRNKIRRE